MVPYFDPGVWGGDWMKTHFDLPENGSNYAWSFDGVPEENSLLLDFGSCVVETPALNLVYMHPRELLGDRVHARFGKEFAYRSRRHSGQYLRYLQEKQRRGLKAGCGRIST